MSSGTTELAAPGWYRDPSGSGRRRWWNGLAWTDYMDDDLVLQGVPNGAVIQPMILSSVNLNPWPIWVFALLPLASLAPLLFVDYAQLLRDLTTAYLSGTSSARIQLGLLPLSLINYAIVLGAYALTVGMAAVDYYLLRHRIGVVRPFHWAWAFLAFLTGLVYLVGRAVVIRRRTGQGARWPVWVYLLVSVVVFFAPAVKMTFAVSEALPQILQELEQQQFQLPGEPLDA